MSRLGNAPIQLPDNVEVKIASEKQVTVKGPKGELSLQLLHGVSVNVEEKVATIKNESTTSSFHGLYRMLLKNMVIGVTTGFEKKLLLIGVGFKAAVSGNKLVLNIGYSLPVELDIPEGIEVKVDKNTAIIISGVDKQAVGQFAATVRAKRPPEPYKGKGIRYENEIVRKKAGKAAKSK